MKKPTEEDIEITPRGFSRLPCDGRHDWPFHFYLYFTNEEIIDDWEMRHPSTFNQNSKESATL